MKLRIRSLPARGGDNPYVELFYDALEAHEVELVGPLELDLEWLAEHLDTFDAIHLHWPEHILARYAPPWLDRVRGVNIRGSWRVSKHLEHVFSSQVKRARVKWLESVLKFLRTHQKKIIWTWHNHVSHNSKTRLGSDVYSVLLGHADLVIFHSHWSEKMCREAYPIETDTVVMMHGNYDGVYPPPRQKDVVAKDLTLDPEQPIVGCLGNIRSYKGIDLVCRAIGSSDKPVQFLCAGDPHAEFDLDALKIEFKTLKGAVLLPRRISDQEFSDFTNLCDIILLPYRQITGSGALLAALTLGRGVIASDLPFFREILGAKPMAGRLVEPENPNALASAISDYLEVPPDLRQMAARKLADLFRWDEVIKPVAEALSRLKS